MTLNNIREDLIPDKITSLEQWICWREKERDGKLTKIPTKPYETKPSPNAKTNDPETWRDFDSALNYHRTGNMQTEGVGFVFTADSSITGIDLDDCCDPDTGEIADWAQDIIERLDSYTEVSPSGTGVHILVEGALPEGRNQRDGVEMYDDGRFFTVTGAHVEGTPKTVNSREEALRSVHADYVQAPDEEEPVDSGDDTGANPSLEETPPAEPGADGSVADDPAVVAVAEDTYPGDLCGPAIEQWVTWTPEDSRGIRACAPWEYGHDRYIKWKEAPEAWTDFQTAQEWAAKLPGQQLAFIIRDRDEYDSEDVVLVDYDDVRDPETGVVHPTVREHLAEAASYADVSRSGTGIHLLCRGKLPDDVRSISDTLPPDETFPAASIEVYASTRLVPMTGDHVACTPPATGAAQAFLDGLVAEYEATSGDSSDGPDTNYSEAEIAAMDTTGDIKAIQDAITYTNPADIEVKSELTEVRDDGTKSRNPKWAYSQSGTRLGELHDGWVYRDGNIGLDALQLVALEEGIITDERTVPRGRDFFRALDELRARGAHIPTFNPDSDESGGGPDPDTGNTDASARAAEGPSGTAAEGHTDEETPAAEDGDDAASAAEATNGEAAGESSADSESDVSSPTANGSSAPPSTDADVAVPSSDGDADSPVGVDSTGEGERDVVVGDELSDDEPTENGAGSGADETAPAEPDSAPGDEGDPAADEESGAEGNDGDDPGEQWPASESGLKRKFGEDHPEIEDEALEYALHGLARDEIPLPVPQRLDQVGGPGHALGDEEVLRRAFDSKKGDKIEWLYDGDSELWGPGEPPYSSWKDATTALLYYLAFWTAGDLDQTERLFRNSGLMREEWDRYFYSETVTYGEVALLQAVIAVNDSYTPPEARGPDPAPWGSGSAGGASAGTADSARLRGTAGAIDMDEFEEAQRMAARAHRYEEQFRECERQLADCRELVQELWERLRLYREVVGVDPERMHGLDPETLTAAGVNVVLEDGPTGRPPSPPRPPSPRDPAREEGDDASGLEDGEASRSEPVEWADEPVDAGGGPREPFVPDRDGGESDVRDVFSDDTASEDDEDRRGFFSRFFS